MRKLVLAGLMAAVSSTAFAADVFAEAPAGFNWSGVYVGGLVGHGWADGELRVPLAGFNSDPGADGFLAGAYAGVQYQLSNNVVLGLEADIQYRNGDGSAGLFVGAVPAGADVAVDLNWTASARLRAGYAVDRWLPYVTGGVSFADYDGKVLVGGAPLAGYVMDKTSTGWTIGAGVEYAFTDNLILRGEYRYNDFGKENVSLLVTPGIEQTFSLVSHDVMVGLSYKF